MRSAEARVTTDRSERYLEQLCSHLGQMQQMRHLPKAGHGGTGVPRVQQLERTPGGAVIRFADGCWSLQAAADALVLRVEADDPAALDRLKTAIAARISKIGRRDGLTVAWHEASGQGARGDADGPNGDRPRTGTNRRNRWRRLGWFAAIALAAVLHLGLIGSLLGTGRWKDAAADAILALLAVKLVMIALHTKLRRGTSRHG